MLRRFGMHFSERGSTFELYLQRKICSIFHCTKAIFGYKKFFFMILIGTSVFLR